MTDPGELSTAEGTSISNQQSLPLSTPPVAYSIDDMRMIRSALKRLQRIHATCPCWEKRDDEAGLVVKLKAPSDHITFSVVTPSVASSEIKQETSSLEDTLDSHPLSESVDIASEFNAVDCPVFEDLLKDDLNNIGLPGRSQGDATNIIGCSEDEMEWSKCAHTTLSYAYPFPEPHEETLLPSEQTTIKPTELIVGFKPVVLTTVPSTNAASTIDGRWTGGLVEVRRTHSRPYKKAVVGHLRYRGKGSPSVTLGEYGEVRPTYTPQIYLSASSRGGKRGQATSKESKISRGRGATRSINRSGMLSSGASPLDASSLSASPRMSRSISADQSPLSSPSSSSSPPSSPRETIHSNAMTDMLLARPVERTTPWGDEGPIKGITWHKLHEVWEVRWYAADSKRRCKTFSVKKLGGDVQKVLQDAKEFLAKTLSETNPKSYIGLVEGNINTNLNMTGRKRRSNPSHFVARKPYARKPTAGPRTRADRPPPVPTIPRMSSEELTIATSDVPQSPPPAPLLIPCNSENVRNVATNPSSMNQQSCWQAGVRPTEEEPKTPPHPLSTAQ